MDYCPKNLKIGKLNQFARDSIVLQTFLTMGLLIILCQDTVLLSLTVIWIPTLSPTLLINLGWNTEATMCLHWRYKSQHSDLGKKKKGSGLAPALFKYFPPTREFKQKTVPQCTFHPTGTPRIEAFQLFGSVYHRINISSQPELA